MLDTVLAGALVIASSSRAESPPLPASQFGDVQVAGEPASAGTEISAWLAGRALVSTPTFERDGASSYRLDIPGDRADTPEIEGAIEGEPVEIRVGGAPAAVISWHGGTYAALPLSAAAGADLAVSIDDGVPTVNAGESVDFAVVVTNGGPGAASGVRLEVELPAIADLVAANAGGALVDGVLTWPPFDLAEGANAARSFTVSLASAVPAGLESIATRARVAHDGATGADPDADDDLATDTDQLLAEPDLGVALSDGRAEARPGETLASRLVIRNDGRQGATGVAAALGLPVGVDFYSASHGGSLAAGEVRWPEVELAAGGELTRTVTIRVVPDLDPGVTALAFLASARDDGANGADADPLDNSAVDVDPVLHAPDLAVDRVTTSGLATDLQSLEVTGTATVELANRGTLAAGSFGVVVFSDVDGDRDYDPGTDAPLGSAVHSGLGARDLDSVAVTLGGVVRFRGERLFAKADPDLAWQELDENNNVGDSAGECAVAPPTAPFAPVVELEWPPAGTSVVAPGSVDSLSTPIVVQLTDDNGDGRWDEHDVPDIAFVTTNFYELMEPQIYLRAIRGDTGAALFDVNGFLPHPTAPSAFSFSGLAAGDIDNDGRPELVTTTFGPAPNNVLIALEHTGARKWQSAVYRTHPDPTGLTNRDNPAIADLDADGFAEIVVGANVFDRFGHLLWRGTGGQAYQSSGNSGDRGGAISVVADVDLDGRLEVVTGNTLYRHDGEIVWQVPLSDGYPAVANFDADPRPEIVVVSQGSVRLHDADGALLWGPVELPGSDPEAGGAPTVADFDGDGAPEIGVAGSDVYVVFEPDGTIRWQASTQDYTSNLTGSTVFDLDGDGAFEVIYRDERRLRVYRGDDGEVLFEDVVSSNTWTEEPVVADVDRDGNAEIVVTSDRAPDVPMPGGERTAGLRVYGEGSDGWTWARSIWNQHAYTPDQIADDASIPANPAWGWLDHNTFRANLPPGGDPSAAPNLTASRMLVDLGDLPLLQVVVRIGNAGRTPVAPGLPVAFYDGDPANGAALLGVVPVPVSLAPGDSFDLEGEFTLALPASGELVVVADDDGNGGGRERECDESDNIASLAYDATALGLWVGVDDGTGAVAAGEEVTYQIVVANGFAGTASGVAIVDTLPEHTLFLTASDGGEASGGTVTWPLVSLASGASTTRTLTVRLDPALPSGVASIANQVAVTDDGSQGPEPSPWNNVAADVDAVITVTADAGGPYFATEGDVVALDGTASFDRDGTIVAFEWDLDGDGEFDDGVGPSATVEVLDEGVRLVRLRVRDDAGEIDVDGAAIEVSNGAPQISGPGSFEQEEGSTLTLAGVRVEDPGPLDLPSATVDWGDGAIESAVVEGGALLASHVYVEDGSYPIAICAADGDGGENCATASAEIANALPQIEARVALDFFGWEARELAVPASTLWDLSADGRTVTQRRNGEPALLVGDFTAFGRHEVALRVADSWDDDYVGLALGVVPDALGTPASDFLLIDWKRNDQDGARRGLALSRVHGAPSTAELWSHADQAANGAAHRVEELARGLQHGEIGWARHTEYRLRIDFAPNRLRLWIDEALELDVVGSFPAGRLALYDYSQSNTIFTAVGSELGIWGSEGTAAPLRARFADPGTMDLHSARMDWGDGAVGPVPLVEELGQGEVVAEHLYLDDGDWTARLCVTDDDDGEQCAELPARVGNVAPHLLLAIASSGFREDPVTLAGATFTDPGVLDLHTATVDWGDGHAEAAAVVEAGGAGSLEAAHDYGAPGTYVVRVCLDDGDGGVACDERVVALLDRFLDLGLTKSSSVVEARPGERIIYTLEVRNLGTLPATGVTLADRLPEHLLFVAASDGGILAGDEVSWSLGALAAGEAVIRTLSADVAAAAPFGAVVTNSALVVDDGASGPDGAPANNQAVAPVLLSDALTPIVTLPAWTAILESGTLPLSGARWSDTTPGEAHTATVDWGDGASGPVTLSPAVGTGGDLVASHAYVEDGLYPVEICVTDAAGHVGCSIREVAVDNAAPAVVEPGVVGLGPWREEEYETPDPSAVWVVAADGLSVLQTQNSQPSVFFSPFPAYGVFLEGTVTVGERGRWDDDFIGFVLGFDAGDTLDPAADFLLVDWKQWDQGNRRGLALSRVTGIATADDLWIHAGHVTELARGATLGDTNWREWFEYRFRFEYSETRIRIWVDDVLQFDLEGDFPDGNFGFYNFSQSDVLYRGFSSGLEQRFEGESFQLRAPFSDLGRLDTHFATIDWDDGAVSPAVAETVDGFGFAAASHDYLDDGDFQIEVCVEDDEGAEGCGRFALLVLNRPPEVVAGPEAFAVAGEASEMALATFVDPGRLDSHTASVDWGDGASAPAAVVEDAGQGSVAGRHLWSAPGSYAVEVCVTDDDGGTGCDTLDVEVLAAPPELAADKTATPIDRDGDGQVSPGDDLVYRVEIVNSGGSAVSGLTFTDPIPAHVRVIPGTVAPSLLALSEDPVTISIPELAPGASLVVQFAVTIDSPLPPGVREIVNSGTLVSDGSPPVLTDDPALPGSSDPTRVPVAALPTLTLAKSATLVDRDDNGVATPGDEIEWRLALSAAGTTAATGLVVADPVPSFTALVAGSTSVSGGSLVGLDPIVWAIETLEVGASVELVFRTVIDLGLPGGIEEIVNQATVASLETDGQLSDDPATPEPADPTRVPLHVSPMLTAAGVAVVEGGSGTVPVVFELELDRAAAVPVSVDWATSGGTAIAGEDFVASAGTLTFAPGEVTASVVIQALGDAVVEADEVFSVVLSNPVLLSLGTPSVQGTLLNDDATAVVVGDVTVAEGESARFTLGLSAPSALPVAVDWVTADLSATAGVDYEAASGSVNFAPLVTSAAIAVATLDDALSESDESFRLVLTSAGSVGLPDPEAVATILDDDTVQCALACPGPLVVSNDAGLCGAAVSLPAPVPSGSCGEVTCVPGSGDDFPLGTTTVLCSSAAAAVTCTFPVTVIDAEPPALLGCPTDVALDAPPGALSWPYEYAPPDGVDNCPGVAAACAPPSGSAFPAGATTVVCTATDAVDLSATCAFEVAVEPGSIEEIPALSGRALALLVLLLGASALVLLSRRRV